MDIREELACSGVYPPGPVSAWPRDRNERLMAAVNAARKGQVEPVKHATKVKASTKDMITGFSKATGQAVRFGKVSSEVRNERFNTCKGCPSFIEDSKRCSECGCNMQAKTWIGGDPKNLCPLQKWAR